MCTSGTTYPAAESLNSDGNQFTNINKTNNHLSPSLNSLNIKKTTTCDVGNSGPGLELVQKCSGVSGYGIPIIPS
jgi:hypothetical protein